MGWLGWPKTQPEQPGLTRVWVNPFLAGQKNPPTHNSLWEMVCLKSVSQYFYNKFYMTGCYCLIDR